ncbi:MAG: peptidoglycan-binding domain-containing protein [Bacteroidales bacterium]|nr:peptidoglycan-binding domain-containing protein [Bacteroidales bacterium]
MKNSVKNKIKALLLTAAAALLPTHAQAEETTNFLPDLGNNDDFFGETKRSWGKVFKNVAKLDKNGDVKYIASHRSHMSHRSGGGGGGYGHRSHYSHYSSYGGGSSHYSSSSSSRSSSSSYSKPKPKTAGDYSIGDRTLKTGIHGSDVTSLTGYLATALYINRSWIKEKEGYSLYDATIASAVKHFQKDAGLPQTGVADQTTIDKLKSWDNSKTTVILGTRELSYSESSTDKGTDVTELVNLLTKAGFAPDPKKIVMTNDGRTEFTKDIATAVRFFQAYNSLSVTGRADEATIKVLKAKAQ